jgi:hypothetical protein
MVGLRRASKTEAVVETRAEAVMEADPGSPMVGAIREFNTGRQYGPGGQRIAYAVVQIDGEARVAFCDHDRGIRGALPMPEDAGLVRDGYVLNRYDAGDYEVGGPHAAALMEQVGDIVATPAGNPVGLRKLHADQGSVGGLQELLARPGFKATAIGRVVVKAEESLPGWFVPEVALILADSERVGALPKPSGSRWTNSRSEFWAGRPEIGDAARFANGFARASQCFDKALIEDVFMVAYQAPSRRVIKGLCDRLGFHLYPNAVNAADDLLQPVEQDPDVNLDGLKLGVSLLSVSDDVNRVFGNLSRGVSLGVEEVRTGILKYAQDLLAAGEVEDGQKIRTRSGTGYIPYRLRWAINGLGDFVVAAHLRDLGISVLRGDVPTGELAKGFADKVLEFQRLKSDVERGVTLYKEKMENYAEELPRHAKFFKARVQDLADLIAQVEEVLGEVLGELPLAPELTRHLGLGTESETP